MEYKFTNKIKLRLCFWFKYISINNAIKEFENTTGIKHENVIKFETRILRTGMEG